MPTRIKLVFLLCAACIVATVANRWTRARPGSERPLSVSDLSVRPVSVGAIPAFMRALRPIFPYSIIPGGVFSRDELKARLQTDAVAQQHYARFDTTRAWLVRLQEDRFQYVSYRKGNEIFWTKKKLRIPQGEVLITDGRQFARTRCGNLLSDRPRALVDPREPAEALTLPSQTPDSLSDPRIGFQRIPEAPVLALTMPPADRMTPQSPLLFRTPAGFPPQTTQPALIGVYFSTSLAPPARTGYAQPVTTSTIASQVTESSMPAIPVGPVLQITPPVGAASQLPPSVTVIPEPRFLVAALLLVACVLLGSSVLRERLTTRPRPTPPY